MPLKLKARQSVQRDFHIQTIAYVLGSVSASTQVLQMRQVSKVRRIATSSVWVITIYTSLVRREL